MKYIVSDGFLLAKNESGRKNGVARKTFEKSETYQKSLFWSYSSQYIKRTVTPSKNLTKNSNSAKKRLQKIYYFKS